MKEKRPVEAHIEKIIDMGFDISKPEAPPFFKDKVLNKLFDSEEAPQAVFSWFSPKYQIALLACVLILNSYALLQSSTNNTDYESGLSSFAEAYNITSKEDASIIR